MKSFLNVCGVGLLTFTAIAGLLLQSTKITLLSTVLPISLIILIVIGLFALNRPADQHPDKTALNKLDSMLDQADKMKDKLRK